ncbi:unnamed protein product [Boreogadus saida]
MSLSRAPARDTYESPSPRERIRSHMKMVIQQLDGILKELKDVAKELREVQTVHLLPCNSTELILQRSTAEA